MCIEVADLLGVNRNTFKGWLTEGRDDDCPDPMKVKLAEECDKARCEYDGKVRRVWKEHIETSPAACLAEMRARFPDQYEREQKTKVELTAPKQLTDLRGASQAELDALEAAERIKERLADRQPKLLRG